MTLTIDLTPEETRRVEQAKAQGIDVQAIFKGVIAGLPPVPEEQTPGAATLALFAQWAEEDANLTEEECAEEEARWEEFKTNINRWRAESGEEPVF